MAFSDFKYPKVLTELGLTERVARNMFAGVPGVPPSPISRAALPIGLQLGVGAHSEFSRAVWMVGPVLADLWDRYDGHLSIIGGAEFVADPAARLTGECDFVIGRGPQRSVVVAPLLVMFEAKRDSIPDGLGQCIAAMVGAQRFNQREGAPVDPIYGCVTTGTAWKFLRLSGSVLELDGTEYTYERVDKILGILMQIAGPPPVRS